MAPTPARTFWSAAQQHPALAQLIERNALSRRCWEVVRHQLPDLLLPHLKPGPVSEGRWVVYAASTSVASKLRQLEPLLLAALADSELPVDRIQVKKHR